MTYTISKKVFQGVIGYQVWQIIIKYDQQVCLSLNHLTNYENDISVI